MPPVIGRDFSYPVLRAVAGMEDAPLQTAPTADSAHQLGNGQRANSAGGAGARGFALGRSNHAGAVAWHRSQLLQNTPLYPIADWGRQRFGGADIPAEQRLADLENTLALIKLDPGENAPLLAPLLDIPLPHDRAATLEPEVLRRRTRRAGAIAGANHRTARVPAALGRALASQHNLPGSA